MLKYGFLSAIWPGRMHTEELRAFELQYTEIQLKLWYSESEDCYQMKEY